MFDALKRKDVEPSSGAEPGAVADGGTGPVGAAVAGAEAGLQKRGRGRPRKDGTRPATRAPAEGADADAFALAPQLFSPEAWAPIMTMPADAMLALTGREHWNLSDRERTQLSVTASTAAQYMGIQSPKSLALALCALAIITTYAPRIVKEFSAMRDERAKKLDNKNGS